MEHQKFLQRSIVLATENVANSGGPFGALIVKDGVVIAEGVNRVTATKDPTAHAEVVAIRRACEALGNFQLDGCILYTSCEPCPMCLGAIYWARPDAVYFAATQHAAAAVGFDDAFIYEEILLPPAQRHPPFIHMPLPEDKASFEAWTQQQGKTAY